MSVRLIEFNQPFLRLLEIQRKQIGEALGDKWAREVADDILHDLSPDAARRGIEIDTQEIPSARFG